MKNLCGRIDPLTEVLISCVNGGASVGFMLPDGERLLLACENGGGAIVGCVQLVVAQPENQPHRADVVKLLVHQNARRQGVARRLMQALETLACQQGKNVLVLDTATGSDAEFFYQQCGWRKGGEIPRYALMPDGSITATAMFYKLL